MSFPQTPLQTEPIFAALFALGCSINTPATPLKLTSRVFKQWSQVPASNYPAFYQQETTQNLDGWDRGIGRRKLRAWWWMYLPTSSDDRDVVATRVNNYLDALLGSLSPKIRGMKQTLGIPGVVNVYPDGALLLDEGLMEPPAVFRIPITILIGN